MQKSDWPFDDPPHVAVLTTKRILREHHPILLVIHEDEDEYDGGGWQFLDGLDLTEADGSVVSLQAIVSRDATLRTLAELPPGWYAGRTDVNAEWVRAKMPPMNKPEDDK